MGPDQEDIATFRKITGVTEATAVLKLKHNHGDLNDALIAFFKERKITQEAAFAAPGVDEDPTPEVRGTLILDGDRNIPSVNDDPIPEVRRPVDDNKTRVVKSNQNSQKVPPFLSNLYHTVNDRETDHMISWGNDGSTIVIWREKDFIDKVVNKYSQTTNFGSFVRQLTSYGFAKVSKMRSEYFNSNFRRGQEDLLGNIVRKGKEAPQRKSPTLNEVTAGEALLKISADSNKQKSPSTAASPAHSNKQRSPSTAASPPQEQHSIEELLVENERLRLQILHQSKILDMADKKFQSNGSSLMKFIRGSRPDQEHK